MAWVKIFLHITSVIIASSFGYGCLSKISSGGASVARARAAKVSIIKLTQSIWTALRGVSVVTTAPKNTMNIATTLTVS